MLMRFLKSNHLYIPFLIPLLPILLWYFNLSDSFFQPSPYQPPLYQWVKGISSYPIIVNLLSISLIISQAFYLVYINRIYNFISNRTYLTSILYVLISCSLPNLNFLSPAIIANLFILPMLVQIFSSYKKQKISREAFNSGLLIALASLFYLESLYLIPFIYISFIILNTNKIRPYLAISLGIILPYFLMFCWYAYFDQMTELKELYRNIIHLKTSHFELSKSYLLFIIILGLLLFYSIWNISSKYSNKKVSTRKYFTLFIIFFIITAVSFILSNFKSLDLLIVSAIPISYIISNYFLSNIKPLIQNILLYSFLLSIILLRIF